MSLLPAPEEHRCTAKSRQTGERCKHWAINGTTKCYYHGGVNNHRGIAHPNFKHGRYSKYLPAKYLENYKLALKDNGLIVQQDEIALLDTRVGELLQKIDTGESGSRWNKLKALRMQLLTARAANDLTGAADRFNDILAEIEQAGDDSGLWSEIRGTIDDRRKLAEAERRRMVDLQQMVTAEQLLSFITYIGKLVVENVTDRKAIARISEGLDVVIGNAPARYLKPAGNEPGFDNDQGSAVSDPVA